ncbi:MAG TPA: 7-cyano-7-deazaguanine synthase [Symbiobacteriaceae bacterium]|nr:7-cyano-7-deazaguanine synthase [Symbiobacteriaceae bacterium]
MPKPVGIVLLSGGLDSATLLYDRRAAGYEIEALFVDYGQRMAAVEERAATEISIQAGTRLHIVRCPLPGELTSGWLVDTPESPDWRSHSQKHLVTNLPHRNLLLGTLAAMLATKRQAQAVFLASIDIEADAFPDSTEAFTQAIDHVVRLSDPRLSVMTPFISWTKRQVASRALELGVPVELTFSCTFAVDHHCMECPSCLDREDALSFAATDKK